MKRFHDWRRPGLVPGLVVIACLGVLTAYAWVRIPPDALVVIKVDFDGTPTNAESKGFALLFGPILLICLAPLLDVVPFVPYGKESVFYRDGYNLLVWYTLLAVMSVVQALIVVGALRNT